MLRILVVFCMRFNSGPARIFRFVPECSDFLVLICFATVLFKPVLQRPVKKRVFKHRFFKSQKRQVFLAFLTPWNLFTFKERQVLLIFCTLEFKKITPGAHGVRPGTPQNTPLWKGFL